MSKKLHHLNSKYKKKMMNSLIVPITMESTKISTKSLLKKVTQKNYNKLEIKTNKMQWL
jgi:hypothetical protein